MTGKARTTGRTEPRAEEGETPVRRQNGRQAVAESHPQGPRTATLNLPFMTAQFRAPEMHVPSMNELAGAARGAASGAASGARSLVPSRGTALFLGGLAATAVVGAIEWPVAAAIGIGTAFARRGGGKAPHSPGTAQSPGTASPGTTR